MTGLSSPHSTPLYAVYHIPGDYFSCFTLYSLFSPRFLLLIHPSTTTQCIPDKRGVHTPSSPSLVQRDRVRSAIPSRSCSFEYGPARCSPCICIVDHVLLPGTRWYAPQLHPTASWGVSIPNQGVPTPTASTKDAIRTSNLCSTAAR